MRGFGVLGLELVGFDFSGHFDGVYRRWGQLDRSVTVQVRKSSYEKAEKTRFRVRARRRARFYAR